MLLGAAILLTAALACTRYATGIFTLKWAALLLGVKILSGATAAVYYLYISKGGDILYYHTEAIRAVAAIKSGYPLHEFVLADADPSAQITPQARSFFFIKVLSLIYLLTGPYFWLGNLLFSLVGFAAIVYFTKRLSILVPDIKVAATIILFFWPGIAVWGGGIGKESLMLSSLLVLSGFLLPVLKGETRYVLLHGSLAVLSFFVLLNLRPFVLMGLLPCLLLGWVIYRLRVSNSLAVGWSARAGAILLILLLAFLFLGLDYSFRPAYFFTAFENNHAAVVAHSRPGHVVSGLEELRQWPEMGWQIALATIAGILGPFVWEISSWWELLLLVEPLLLLGLVFTRKNRRKWPPEIWIPLIIYIVGMSCMITLSTPNYGSISRYRIAYYPALLFLVVYNHPWLIKLSGSIIPQKA